MKNKIKICVFPTVLLLLTTITANAQKLPNVQKISLRAPADIKIDGNTTEWGDKFQAYNNATDVYYTISNDDENIYFTIKAKQGLIIDKIIQGGISITVNHTLKKKEVTPIIITYPVLQRVDKNSISHLFNSKFGVSDNVGVDNSIESLNNSLTAKSRFISVTGVKNLSDGVISVNNEQSIKAVSKFDKPLVYVYELAIPLKYLALPNNGADGFSYHIKLNVDIKSTMPVSAPAGLSNRPPPPAPDPGSVSATDFWGDYTLARKK